MSELRDRLADTVSLVLHNLPIGDPSGWSMDTVEDWDSIAQINLVLAVERAFDVTFSPEEAAEFIGFDQIAALLERHTGT